MIRTQIRKTPDGKWVTDVFNDAGKYTVPTHPSQIRKERESLLFRPEVKPFHKSFDIKEAMKDLEERKNR